MNGRVLYAAFQLLDRQLRDREGRLCGKVDDLELERSPDGHLYVVAIVAGPGALWRRMGRRRLGAWLERGDQVVNDDARDPALIPMELAHRIGPVVDLAVESDSLATNRVERWVRDHIISHLPGNAHRAPE